MWHGFFSKNFSALPSIVWEQLQGGNEAGHIAEEREDEAEKTCRRRAKTHWTVKFVKVWQRKDRIKTRREINHNCRRDFLAFLIGFGMMFGAQAQAFGAGPVGNSLSFAKANVFPSQATGNGGLQSGSVSATGPFIYWTNQGRVVRGPALELRPESQLRWLREALAPWPRLGFEEVAAPRLEVSPDKRAAALGLAWQELRNASQTVKKYSRLSRGEKDRLSRQIDWSRAIIQAFDTHEAAQKLLRLRNGHDQFFDGRLLRSAGFLDARFGRLKNGAVRAALDREGRAATPAALALALVLAERGDHFGAIQLVRLLEAGVPHCFAPDAYYRALASSKAPQVQQFFQRRLASFRKKALDIWNKKRAGQKGPLLNNRERSILPYAILALAGRKTGNADLQGLPIDILTLSPEIFPLVRRPTSLFALFSGLKSWKGRHHAVHSKRQLVKAFCLAQATRSDDDAEAIYRRMAEILMRVRTGGGVIGKRERRNWLLTSALISAKCRLSSTLLRNYLQRSEDRAEREFFDPKVATAWARRPRFLQKSAAQFARGNYRLGTKGLDLFSQKEIARTFPPGPHEARAYRALFLAKTSLLSNAYRVRRKFPDGAERWVIFRRLGGRDNKIGFFAIVDVTPQIRKKTLQLGVKIKVKVEDVGGLASRISGNQKRIDESLANRARHIIETVRLKFGDQVFKMAFRGTTLSGMHLFASPLPSNGLSNLTAHVNLNFLGHSMPLDFSLYDSHFAFRQRTGRHSK